MKLSMKELYVFACPKYHNMVTMLKWITVLIVDSRANHQIRTEMDEYYCAKRCLHLVKGNTEYEEDLYDEAI